MIQLLLLSIRAPTSSRRAARFAGSFAVTTLSSATRSSDHIRVAQYGCIRTLGQQNPSRYGSYSNQVGAVGASCFIPSFRFDTGLLAGSGQLQASWRGDDW